MSTYNRDRYAMIRTLVNSHLVSQDILSPMFSSSGGFVVFKRDGSVYLLIGCIKLKGLTVRSDIHEQSVKCSA